MVEVLPAAKVVAGEGGVSPDSRVLGLRTRPLGQTCCRHFEVLVQLPVPGLDVVLL